MNIHTALISALPALLLTLPIHAAPPRDRQAYETSTVETAIPNEPLGSLTVRRCATCPPTLVRLTGDSVYRIGRREVTFAEFRDYVRSSGNQMLTVLYGMREGTVRRLVVSDEPRTRQR